MTFRCFVPSGCLPRRHYAGLLCAALVGALALSACSKDEANPAPEEPKVQGEAVSFPASMKSLTGISTEVVQQGANLTLTLPGRLGWNEDRTVRVYSPFAGRVSAILVQPGKTVTAGQALAQLQSADFGSAQAEARKASADAALAKQNLARQKELYEAGVTARKDYEQSQADAARAGAELERTTARLKVYGAGAASVDQTFALKSPIAGLVVEKNINPGMEFRPDQASTPLFVVTDPSQLWATLDANEVDLGRFKPGNEVKLTSTAYPDEVFKGKVIQTADFIDPTARTVKVKVAVPNTDRRLKAEMFVTAALQLDAMKGLVVPSKAVFLQGVKQFVFVKTGERQYLRRAVKVGTQFGQSTEIVEGLKANEMVVVEGNLYLQDILQSAQGTEQATAQAPKVSPPGVQGHGK